MSESMDQSACRACRDDFGALLDNELDARRRELVEAHLAECADCLRDLHGLQRTDRLYQGLDRKLASASFEKDVQTALRPSFARCRRKQRPVWPLAAAAAMVVVMAAMLFSVLQQPDRFLTALVPEAPDSAPNAVGEMPPPAVAWDNNRVEADGLTMAEPPQPLSVGVKAEPETGAQTERSGGELRILSAAPPEASNFEHRDGAWVQAGYEGQPTTLVRAGAELEALNLDPSLARQIASLRPPVIFQHEGEWRRLEDPAPDAARP